mgnify:CR=1 FL=1
MFILPDSFDLCKTSRTSTMLRTTHPAVERPAEDALEDDISCSSFDSHPGAPNCVYVFPDPVCPYESTAEDIPLSAANTADLAQDE